jgi:hypothetical protein
MSDLTDALEILEWGREQKARSSQLKPEQCAAVLERISELEDALAAKEATGLDAEAFVFDERPWEHQCCSSYPDCLHRHPPREDAGGLL